MNNKELILNEKYRVKNNFLNGVTVFEKGEILTFIGGGYSPYDDCYLYEFIDRIGKRRITTFEKESDSLELMNNLVEIPALI